MTGSLVRSCTSTSFRYHLRHVCSPTVGENIQVMFERRTRSMRTNLPDNSNLSTVKSVRNTRWMIISLNGNKCTRVDSLCVSSSRNTPNSSIRPRSRPHIVPNLWGCLHRNKYVLIYRPYVPIVDSRFVVATNEHATQHDVSGIVRDAPLK